MRRFIQVAAVTGFLLPGIAWGQGREIPTASGEDHSSTSGVQAADGSTTSGGAPADTTQPAAPTTPTATPALLPFRNSTLLLDQSTTPETIWRNVQQTAIPSYQWWISFRPRWYFTPSPAVPSTRATASN